MDSITKNLKKLFKGDDVYDMQVEENPYAVKEFVSTGCYILNALIGNGDIMGGLPKGKRIQFGGPSSTGKSYLTAYAAKYYLDEVPGAHLIAFETEGASFFDMMKSVKVDESRITIVPVKTVEKFRTMISKLLQSIKEERDKGINNEYIFLLDSMGMLGTTKENEDALQGSAKADMTRAKLLRSLFRIISLDLFKLQIPILLVNHTYECIDGKQNILMGDDSLKNIKDIFIGDLVKTLHGIQKITNTTKHKIDTYIEIKLNDGKMIKCTPNHKFMIDNNWVEAINIQDGDEIQEFSR